MKLAAMAATTAMIIRQMPLTPSLNSAQALIPVLFATRFADQAHTAKNCTHFICARCANGSYTGDGFRDPAGNALSITNLAEFCRLKGLDFSSMHRLAKGNSKLKSYKGWTHINDVRKRAYVKTYEGFIDPHGTPAAQITNLADFCRKRGLDKTHMVAVANGRIVSRGWTHSCGKRRQPDREYTGFVAPGGAFTLITNLAAFCRACNLCVTHMFEVKSGKRPGHNGWTWRNHDETEMAQWRVPAQAHESPDLGDQPLPATARSQPC